MREPAFWWEEPGIAAALLAPAAALYGILAARRLMRAGRAVSVPVVCIGNFTVGGAGKTPVAIALAKLAAAAGRRPFFLSRGYGGRVRGPLRVAGERAWEVGDEPLLLAKTAPTVVARNRYAGAAFATKAGADLIIMDDGLQNPSLAKDFAIAVVDGRRGIGNARVVPAGPLRAPLAGQFGRVNAVLLVGAPGPAAAPAIDAGRARGLPLYRAQLRPDTAVVASLRGRPVLAFAGIADPGKFFATLESCGIPAAVRAPFPDHHRYRAAETVKLLARARHDGLALVTTEKDIARMAGDPAAAELLASATAFPVTIAFEGNDRSALLAALTARVGSKTA